MKTAIFYNGDDTLEVSSNYFRSIRGMASTGIPKDGIKSGRKIYVAINTLQRIRALLDKSCKIKSRPLI